MSICANTNTAPISIVCLKEKNHNLHWRTPYQNGCVWRMLGESRFKQQRTLAATAETGQTASNVKTNMAGEKGRRRPIDGVDDVDTMCTQCAYAMHTASTVRGCCRLITITMVAQITCINWQISSLNTFPYTFTHTLTLSHTIKSLCV